MGTINTKNFDYFILLACGHTAFQIMCAGVELGIFEHLSKKKNDNLKAIASKLKLAQRPARILLTGLTSLKLLKQSKTGNFSNSEIAQEYLVRDNPSNMIDALFWQKYIVYPGEVDFLESLQKNKNIGLKNFPGPGEALYQRLSAQPKLEKIFQNAMSSISQSANQILAQKVSFAKSKHLVDLGGGDGTNAMALAKANPNLKATVYDSATICSIASQNIKAHKMSMRVDTFVGDFFKDSFPEGMDCALLAHILTIWSPEKNIELLKRIYSALPKNGQVVIFNMMGNDDLSGPMTTALGSPYFLSIATGEGMLYSWSEYEAFLKKAGFKQTIRKTLPRDHGVLIGVK